MKDKDKINNARERYIEFVKNNWDEANWQENEDSKPLETSLYFSVEEMVIAYTEGLKDRKNKKFTLNAKSVQKGCKKVFFKNENSLTEEIKTQICGIDGFCGECTINAKSENIISTQETAGGNNMTVPCPPVGCTLNAVHEQKGEYK